MNRESTTVTDLRTCSDEDLMLSFTRVNDRVARIVSHVNGVMSASLADYYQAVHAEVERRAIDGNVQFALLIDCELPETKR